MGSKIVRFRPDPSALDRPVRDLELIDIRASLFDATDKTLLALRDGRYSDAKRHTEDAQLLCRALRRFEMHQERKRIAGMREGAGR